MNQRIRALAVQAGFYANPDVEKFEKFAELIIQECTELTLDHRNADYYQGWLDYRDEIRHHWGITK